MWQFGITYVHLGVKVCPMQQTMQTLKLGKVYESRFFGTSQIFNLGLTT
jgi:hypothetical protein